MSPAPSDSEPVPAPFGSGVAFVTGASGFLGGAVAEALGGAGWRVAGFGFAPEHAAAISRLDRLAGWTEGALDAAALAAQAQKLGRPELLFHAAGGASVGASIADPERDQRWTIGSLEQALAFLKADAPEARLIYPSSAAVYGSRHDGPILEDDALDPISPYGRHKLQAERMILEGAAGFGLDAVIIRFFSLYGPGLRKQLPFELAGRLLGGAKDIQLSGTGEEVRDFLFIDDAVRLVGLAARSPRQAHPLVTNGGAGRAVTVRILAEALGTAIGWRGGIGFSGQVRAGDPASLLADLSKARTLGFSPKVELVDGLAQLAAWMREEAATPVG
jgi:UDP-glucose 4-epimerase